MTIRDAGRGTGRLTDDALKQAAMEAAKRAAEASRRAAAEAAARREAVESARRSGPADPQRHTGRLQENAGADFGDLPWEKAGAVVATVGAVGAGVAAVTQSAAYQTVKESLSIKKKVDDIQSAVTNVQRTVASLRETGGGVREAMAALNAPKPPSVRPLDTLGKVNSVIRVTGGVQSAFRLADDVQSFRDGVTVKEATSAAGNALGVVRGVDEASKLIRGTSAGVLGRMAPGISIAASSVDAVKRVQNLTRWNDLSTQDKVANVAFLLGDVADIAGNFFPPAKAVGAGLALVGMAAENWGTITNAASKVADVTTQVAGAVADRAREAVADVADTARNVVQGAREAVGSITNGIKNVFGGL